jgi:hypothetical protein
MPLNAEKSLSRRLLDELTGFLPDDGPVVVARDAEGRYQAADAERINVEAWQECFESLHEQTCDGWEPAMAQRKGGYVIALQVGMDVQDTTTVFLVLEGYTQHTATANMGLIEMLLSQIQLISSLLLRTGQLERFVRFGGRITRPSAPSQAG